MATREKVYLKDLPLYDEVDHSASAEQFPGAYAKLGTLTHGSKKKLVWECSEGHEPWESTVNSRSEGRGCPTCGRVRASGINSTPKPGKSLGDIFPSIAFEWDHDKNGTVSPEDISVSSNCRFWWSCKKGHSWEATVNHRTGGRRSGCPYCSGRLITDNNRLSIRYPSVALEWDHEKNGTTTPEDVTYSARHKFWWLCKAGHSWEATVNNRTKGSGCPYCSGRRVTDNNRLSVCYPSIAIEWDYEKNGTASPEDVTVSTHRKFWWLCKEGHSWEAGVKYRTADGTGCPKCAKRTSRIEKRFIEVFAEKTDFILTAHGMRLNQISYSSGRRGVEVDMVFFFNHHYLLLEYDGSYWHREKADMDTEKSRALLSLGDNVLHARIRERIRGNELPDLDLAHDRFAQFRHAYHLTEDDSVEATVKEIERWFLEKIGE